MNFLFPDAPEAIFEALASETDVHCQQAGLSILADSDLRLAESFIESVASHAVVDASLQLSIIVCLRKLLSEALSQGDHVRTDQFYSLMNKFLEDSTWSSMAKYEIVNSLLHISNLDLAPESIVKLIGALLSIAVHESDNLCKLMVLTSLLETLKKYPLQYPDAFACDCLQLLQCGFYQVRASAIECAILLMTRSNASASLESIASHLLSQSISHKDKNQVAYLTKILRSVTQIVKMYPGPSIAECALCQVLLPFSELLKSEDSEVQSEATKALKEILDTAGSQVCAVMLPRLLKENLKRSTLDCKSASVILWMMGEYLSADIEKLTMAINTIKSSLGPLPLSVDVQPEDDESEISEPKKSLAPRILQDGTYATDSKYTSGSAGLKELGSHPLRSLLHRGEYVVGQSLAQAFLKTFAKFPNSNEINKLKAEALILLSEVLKFSLDPRTGEKKVLEQDVYETLIGAIKVIASSNASNNLLSLYAQTPKYLASSETEAKKNSTASKPGACTPPNFCFDLLKCAGPSTGSLDAIEENLRLSKSQRHFLGGSSSDSSSLKKIIQLTGFSDPVYAEAFVSISGTDVVIDSLLVNQTTEETFNNLCLDFALIGSMKIIEKPQSICLLPAGFATLKTVIRLSSNDCASLINGTITYVSNVPGSPNVNTNEDSITLASIAMNPVDFIIPSIEKPASFDFSKLWVLLEWENKINVTNTARYENSHQVLNALLKETGLELKTPRNSLGSADCDYLAANVAGSSVFGDDILANVCLEKGENGITGHVRLRSQSQGMALALGDFIHQMFA